MMRHAPVPSRRSTLQVGGIREPHWHPSAWSAVFGVPAETFSSFKKIDTAIVILRSP
jgi:hypothetical protein